MVEKALTEFEHKRQQSDAWLGPRVHAAVRLTRREAADKRIWEYLTVVEFPHYVRWRCGQEESDQPIPKVRFCGLDQKNSLARLWWTAELTRNGSDYTHTALAFRIPDFSDRWQGLNLMHHRAAALGVTEFLSEFGSNGVTTAQNKAISKALNLALRTMSLDDLVTNPATDAEAIWEWIGEPVDETTMMGELPRGPDERAVPEADIATIRTFLDDLAKRIRLADVKSDRWTAAGDE